MRKESLFIISICLLAVGITFFGCVKPPLPQSPPQFLPPSPTMAVASFENKAGEQAKEILGSGVADMLIAELGGRNCQLLEREILDQILEELGISASDLANPETVAKVSKDPRLESAQYLLIGSIASAELGKIDTPWGTIITAEVGMTIRVVSVATRIIEVTASSTGKKRGADIKAGKDSFGIPASFSGAVKDGIRKLVDQLVENSNRKWHGKQGSTKS